MKLCGLCSKERELRKSHLLPKSIYQRLKDGFEGNDLVFSHAGDKASYYKDFQVKEIFLCDDCEEKFSRHGESQVIGYCHGKNRSFPLLDKMKLAKPIYRVKDEETFLPKDLDLNGDEFFYFALSVLWRSANWPNPKYRLNGSLGIYNDSIKQYLISPRSKPNGIYVCVYADDDLDIMPILSFPTCSKKKGYHHHIFYLPGLKFSILVGNSVGEVKKIYQYFNAVTLFTKYNFRSHPDFKMLVQAHKYELKPKGRLAKENA